jgi:hypothetical protein
MPDFLKEKELRRRTMPNLSMMCAPRRPSLDSQDEPLIEKQNPVLFANTVETVATYLTPELILRIGQWILGESERSFHDRFLDFEEEPVVRTQGLLLTQRTLFRLVLVNRQWSQTLRHMLYYRTVVTNPGSLCGLADCTQQNPYLFESIRELVLMDRTGKSDTESSFYILMYSPVQDQQSLARRALTHLMTGRRSGLISVLFVTANFPELESAGSGASLLPTAHEQAALHGIHSLTLHGFASHLLYTPSSRHSLTLPSLQELTLDTISYAIHVDDWPLMPTLQQLTIRRCSWTHPTLPAPSAAPSLAHIRITGIDRHVAQTGMGMALLVSYIVGHGTKLVSLVVDQTIFDGLRLSGNPWSKQFPMMQELAIQQTSISRVGYWTAISALLWATSLFSGLLPPKLRTLQATGIWPNHFDVTIALQPRSAEVILQAILNSSRAIPAELHVAGSRSFWNNVPIGVLSAVRHRAMQRGAIYEANFHHAEQKMLFMEQSDDGVSLTRVALSNSAVGAIVCSKGPHVP